MFHRPGLLARIAAFLPPLHALCLCQGDLWIRTDCECESCEQRKGAYETIASGFTHRLTSSTEDARTIQAAKRPDRRACDQDRMLENGLEHGFRASNRRGCISPNPV
jgi:hypothetical protein